MKNRGSILIWQSKDYEQDQDSYLQKHERRRDSFLVSVIQ